MKDVLDQLRDLVNAGEAAPNRVAGIPTAAESQIEQLRSAIAILRAHSVELGNGWIGIPKIEWDQAMETFNFKSE